MNLAGGPLLQLPPRCLRFRAGLGRHSVPPSGAFLIAACRLATAALFFEVLPVRPLALLLLLPCPLLGPSAVAPPLCPIAAAPTATAPQSAPQHIWSSCHSPPTRRCRPHYCSLDGHLTQPPPFSDSLEFYAPPTSPLSAPAWSQPSSYRSCHHGTSALELQT